MPGGNTASISLEAKLIDKMSASLQAIEKEMVNVSRGVDLATKASQSHKAAMEQERVALRAKLAALTGNTSESAKHGATLKQMQLASLAAATGSKELASHIVILREEIEKATKSQDAQKKSQEELRKSQGASVEAIIQEKTSLQAKLAALTGNTEEATLYNNSLREMQREALASASGSEMLSSELINLREQVEATTEAQEEQRQETEAQHGAMTALGVVLSAVGAAILASFSAAAISAIDLDTSMIRVKKTSGESKESIDRMSDAFVEMSTKIPVTAKSLAEIAAVAGQIGIVGEKNIVSFTETIAKMASVTDLSADQSAEGMAILANIFKIPIPEISRLASTLNELENTTTATAGELLDMLQRMGGAATTLGLTSAQTAGFAATLKDLGVSTEVAGTGMSQVFIKMIERSDVFSKQAEISIKEWQRLIEKDAVGALMKWIEKFKELDKFSQVAALDKLGIDGERVTGILLKLGDAQDQLTKRIDTASKAYAENTGLQREFSTTMESVSAQADILKNTVMAIAIETGKQLIPSIQSAIGHAKSWVDGFLSLDEGLKANIVTIGLAGGAVTTLSGVVLLLIPRIAETVAVLSRLSGSFSSLIALAVNPWVLGIVAALSALGVAYVSFNSHQEKMVSGMKETLDKLSDQENGLIKNKIAIENLETALSGYLGEQEARMLIQDRTIEVVAREALGSKELAKRYIQEDKALKNLIETGKEQGITTEELTRRVKSYLGFRKLSTEHTLKAADAASVIAAKKHTLGEVEEEEKKALERKIKAQKEARDEVGKQILEIQNQRAALQKNQAAVTQTRAALDKLTIAQITAKTGSRELATAFVNETNALGKLKKETTEAAETAKELKKQRSELEKQSKELKDHFDEVYNIQKQAKEKELLLDEDRLSVILTNARLSAKEKEKLLNDYVVGLQKQADSIKSIEQGIADRGAELSEDEWSTKLTSVNAWYNETVELINKNVSDQKEAARLIALAEDKKWKEVEKIQADFEKKHGSFVEGITDFFNDGVQAMADFFKEAFVAIITFDLKRLANAFLSFADSLFKAFRDAIAKIIVQWALLNLGIKAAIEKLLQWLKDVFSSANTGVTTTARTLTGSLIPAIVATTFAWASMNTQVATGLMLMERMSGAQAAGPGIFGGLVGGGGSGGSGILNIIGQTSNGLSLLTKIFPSFGAAMIKIGASISSVASSVASAITAFAVAHPVIAAIVGVAAVAATIFGFSLFGSKKPPRIGVRLGTKFEGLNLTEATKMFDVGKINVFVVGVKRLSFEYAQTVADELEKILTGMTMAWGETFNRFPESIRVGLVASMQAANEKIAAAFAEIVMVTRDGNIGQMITDLLHETSKKVSRAFRKPLEEGMKLLFESMIPVEAAQKLSDAFNKFADKFSNVGPKKQQIFLESIGNIFDAMEALEIDKDLFSQGDLSGVFGVLSDILESSKDIKKKDIAKVKEALNGFLSLLSSATEFLQNQQDIIDANALSEMAFELKKLDRQFAEEIKQAEALKLTTDKLRASQSIRLRQFVDEFLQPLTDLSEELQTAFDELSGTTEGFVSGFDRFVAAIHDADPEKALAAAQNAFDMAEQWFDSLGDFAGIAASAASRVIEFETSTAEGVLLRIGKLTGQSVENKASALEAIQALILTSSRVPIEERGGVLQKIEESLRLWERMNTDISIVSASDTAEDIARNVSEENNRIVDLWRQLQSLAEQSDEEARNMMTDRLKTIQEAIEAEKFYLGESIASMEASIITALWEIANQRGGVQGIPAQHGMDFIPRDNFPINAHKGEAVITARGNEALGEILTELRSNGGGKQQLIVVQPQPILLDGKKIAESTFRILQEQGENGRRIIPSKTIYQR